ncbi:proteinase [Actinomadura rubrobrunea]|uniref:Proteinase n=1 Tax=Actinomadura rubrobrunea TaxID=115335 RepID=A0A9W6Q047_9ACTN|nr:alpha/beta hydrolase [Actinomadura rubrobrunea]GLW66023.1 proteinase [Actinomadura rubrobrunea]
MKLIAAAAVLTLVALTGCSGERTQTTQQSPPPGSAVGMEEYYQQRLEWSDCGNGFECATAKVPLDYANPKGERLRISLIRRPAEDRSQRIGSLFVNPGGPGGSGVEFVRQAAGAFGADLRRRFDIVGFDPRGVGASSPVRCMTAPQLDAFYATDTTPDDKKEVDALASQSRAYADNCRGKAAKLLPYVGTANAARDIDILRAAAGDDKLTYYGASYGTYLGASYADQFPDKVRALVLDGAVDPRLTNTEMLVEQAKGFETALEAFAADCVKHSGCPLGTDPDTALDRLTEFQKRVDAHPLSNSSDSRPVTEAWAELGLASALYVKENWPLLRMALAQAMQRKDGTLLITLADRLVERGENGSYSNQADANMAVNCVDKPNPADLAAYRKAVDEAAKEAPHFGEFVVWGGLPCIYWPAQTKQKPRPFTAKGAAPILVIGTLRDPATPYKWSENLARDLSSGVLLTLDGDGHTAYLQNNPCIVSATDRYLVTGQPPKDGTVCR